MRVCGKSYVWGAVLVLLAVVVISGVVWCLRPDAWQTLESRQQLQTIEIQHPIRGAVMPANMPSPVVLWRTNLPGISRWGVGFKAGGERWWFENVQPMWRPGEAEWRGIRAAAKDQPIELVLAGFSGSSVKDLQARASVRFTLARESVESPLFYREVNLPFIDAVKDPSRIRWRFGSLAKSSGPPVVLEKLPVCGNCHSFSRNGEFLAMDVDYANNKASYVITRTAPEMRLATSDLITWDDFRREDGKSTFGLLSQISPDGRFVLSTVKDRSIFVPRPDLAFSQLFFPIKGIIAVYDREAKRFFPLPGADDPALVQSNPTWSPDGQWVVFARRAAAELKPSSRPETVLVSGEDTEEFLQRNKEFRFNLYRIPFNGGKGGQAEPLRGASGNGRSNYFPKYSPDGRWIVFCQAANYMLLQPDSELFIIPAQGGEARRLGCNLGRMNSWHSWSPDGRWLVFSSKAHSDYTQLYLARITPDGEASPPAWLAHMVEPGRAANIPEFVALPSNAILKVKEQFLDDYSFLRAGDEHLKAGDVDQAIAKYQAALSINANCAKAHERLGFLLHNAKGRPQEGLVHLQAAQRLVPHQASTLYALAGVLMDTGDYSNAIVHLTEAARWASPGSRFDISDSKHDLPEAVQFELGVACAKVGDLAKAEEHYQGALRLQPAYFEAHNNLGNLLLRSKRLGDAETHLTEALKLAPTCAPAHNSLGIVRQQQDRRAEAAACFQNAIQYGTNYWQAHFNLARVYLSQGNREKAASELRETLRIEPSYAPAQQALAKIQGQTSGPGAPGWSNR